MNKSLAPIVLFTYNRPIHTKAILDSLAKNIEAKDSVLYIFCDGIKKNASENDKDKIAQVQTIVQNEYRFKKIIVDIQDENRGLDNSVIEGVTFVIDIHEKIIVLEDDLIVSPYFLAYMNDSLIRYENENSVGQIGACNFFACGKRFPKSFFVSIPDCLGWATWKNRWDFFNPNADELKMELLNNKEKRDKFNVYGACDFMNMFEQQKIAMENSWDIRWQAVCILRGWLTLYPNPSMSNHIESLEATHVNKAIIPPLTIHKPNFQTIEVTELEKVIKALKLGYSKKGDYFGRKKRISFKKRLKKIIKLFLPRPLIDILKRIKK